MSSNMTLESSSLAPPLGDLQAAVPVSLDSASLEALGLAPSDVPAVMDLAHKIDPRDASSIAQFGQKVVDHTSQYADELLGQIHNRDLDAAGQKLSQVVNLAKGINMNALSDRRSKLPVIGPLIDRFKLTRGKFVGQFETTRQQIDALVSEVQQTQDGLQARNESLEQMFVAVKEEFKLLGVHIAAGNVRIDEMRREADDLRVRAASPTAVQDLADLEGAITNLDLRIGNMRVLQQSALQTLPQIRVIQSSNRVLVDKFNTIQLVTVPAWKRQFMLVLGLNEQRNAVDLAKVIDDTTNDLLRRNADLLQQNAVQTAQANQRLSIDLGTLQHVQDSLIKTVEDVIRIQRDGVGQRQAAERQIQSMRSQLKGQLTLAGGRDAA